MFIFSGLLNSNMPTARSAFHKEVRTLLARALAEALKDIDTEALRASVMDIVELLMGPCRKALAALQPEKVFDTMVNESMAFCLSSHPLMPKQGLGVLDAREITVNAHHGQNCFELKFKVSTVTIPIMACQAMALQSGHRQIA